MARPGQNYQRKYRSLCRTNDVIPKFKNLFDEATFYDKQWKATWEGQKRPSETEA